MDFTLALAHFCEVHGPTSILCTQLSPVDCGACFPAATTPPSEDVSRNSSCSSSNGGFFDASPPTATPLLSANNAPSLLSPFDSPPTSPKSSGSNVSSYNPYFPDHEATLRSHTTRDATNRFSTSPDSDTESCDNCMFLVPKAMSEQLPDGAPGSPFKGGRGQHGSPVLRTTHPILARGAPADVFERRARDRSRDRRDVRTGSSSTSDDDDLADPLTTVASTPSSASAVSDTSSPNSHTHMLTYVTTKQPLSQTSYSFLRRACIRTLSNETLPKGSPSGPLYFGDPHAGYTIAYVFRVPDPRARGKRRMYALLALGGRDSWRVSKVYVKLTKVFESIASQIISMADSVIEKELTPSPNPAADAASTILAGGGAAPLTPLLLSISLPTTPAPHVEPPSPAPTASPSAKDRPTSKSATTSPTTKYARFNNTSSFLTGKRIDPDGHPRLPAMKAKSLAEIVGKEGFFVELHVKFCVMLHTLAKEFA